MNELFFLAEIVAVFFVFGIVLSKILSFFWKDK